MCLIENGKEVLLTDTRTAVCMSFGIDDPAVFDYIWTKTCKKRLCVVVTTVPTNCETWRSKISACRRVYASPFILRFAVSLDAKLHGLTESEVLRYPNRLVGDLLAIRTWIERFTEADLISDDDPGTSYKGGSYGPSRAIPRLIFPCVCNTVVRTGGHRYGISPELHHNIWKFGIALGKLCGANYVGANGSEATKAVFCNTEFFPLARNRAINGVTAVIKGIRHHIPANVSQEWAMMTGYANKFQGGTLTMMPLIQTYAVNPPSPGSVEASQRAIAEVCGVDVFARSGNCGGGKEKKWNAIFHFPSTKCHVEDLVR